MLLLLCDSTQTSSVCARPPHVRYRRRGALALCSGGALTKVKDAEGVSIDDAQRQLCPLPLPSHFGRSVDLI